jgi:hypothetical protein
VPGLRLVEPHPLPLPAARPLALARTVAGAVRASLRLLCIASSANRTAQRYSATSNGAVLAAWGARTIPTATRMPATTAARAWPRAIVLITNAVRAAWRPRLRALATRRGSWSRIRPPMTTTRPKPERKKTARAAVAVNGCTPTPAFTSCAQHVAASRLRTARGMISATTRRRSPRRTNTAPAAAPIRTASGAITANVAAAAAMRTTVAPCIADGRGREVLPFLCGRGHATGTSVNTQRTEKE